MHYPVRRLALGFVPLLLLPLLTFSALRTQPRPIVAVSPPPDTTDVWLGTSVRVTFAEAMDRNSVETRFAVDPAVPGAFAWHSNANGESVEFQPDDILPATTTYRVTLQAGLRNAEGDVVLDTDYAWSFTTRQAHDTIDFGYGLPIQLVDPDGRNQVQFSAGYPRIRVDFALYDLPAQTLAQRYADFNNYEDPPIDPAELTEAATWQQSFANDDATVGDVTLPDVAPGLYLLVAQHPHAGRDKLIVVVSRHVLTLKQSPSGQVVAWAMRLQDQTPAAGATVSVYDADGARLTQGTTDAGGTAELDAGNAEPRLAIAEIGDELTLAGLDGNWRTRDGYWYWWSADRASDYHAYIYTDRPIYRPGHTVNFAGILRHDDDGDYTPIAASQPVSVTLRDSRNNVVETQVVTTDDFGTVHGSFTLASEPPMGTYNIELEVDDTLHRQEFRVEAYRKPEYEVDVTTSVPYAVAGDDVSITVSADYYFGQPVAGAEVVLEIYRRSSYWYWWEPGGGEQVAELRGTTGSDGTWATDFTTPADLGRDATYSFVASVTDASRQSVEGQTAVPVYWNTFQLSLSTDRYGYEPDEPVVARIAVQAHDGAPVAGQTVTVAVEGGYYNDPEVVAEQEVTTDDQGQAEATFTDLDRGWYRIRAGTVDERGRRAEAQRYVWIYDRAGSWWYSSDDDLAIDTDRDSYAPGDSAQLLIESRVTGVALLTLKRGTVHEERIVELDGPATTVNVDIRDEFAPNIFAAIHVFTTDAGDAYSSQSTPEGRLLVARVEIPVSAASHRLSVSVTSELDQYEPGGQAEFTLRVADAADDPVDALIGLAVVDEAIFALSEDLSADIFESFYGARSDNVATYDSLTPRRYIWSRGVPEDGVGGTPTPSPAPTATPAPSAPSDDTGRNIRQEFRDTAYWDPSIQTGDDGEVTVTVDLPDNLTTWRVIARAVTLDTKVGDATTEILVTQDLIARPALPRFTVLGDRFALDTIAQNFSGQALTGTVTLDGPGLTVLDPGARTVDLPNAGTGVARWTAVASEVGEGSITCAVDTPDAGDAVQLPLRTKPFAVPERWSAAGQADPTAVERFEVPFNAVHEATELTLRLSPSVALGVLDGLDALIDYPYGCVEQTMSRVLPSAVAARAYQELGIPNPKADELPDIIEQGLQKLYGFQHDNGSWGWWYDDEGGVYMTSYVLFGLSMVEQAGFHVDDAVLDRGFAFLGLRLPRIEDPRITAYVLYVKSMAGRGDLEAAQALLPAQDELDAFALAALALTLDAEGDAALAQALIDKLLVMVDETSLRAHWPADQAAWRDYYWRTMSSAEKNTAMALRALVELRPEQPLLPKVVRWLMDQRRGNGWRDTQATAFAVLGLTDFIQVSGELEADYAYTVRLNGEEIAAGQVTPETVTDPIEPIVVAGSALKTGENQFSLERNGDGQPFDKLRTPLYYSLWLGLELFYDGFKPVSSIDEGLAVTRTYRLVEDSRWGRSPDRAPTLARPASEAAPGQSDSYNVGNLVEVHLTVQADVEAWYVVIEDPLPAGFEALNERVNPVSYGDVFESWRWPVWGYNRKNVYDDKVTFFVTRMWPGEHRFSYLMRATTLGVFSALPAEAYPMYEAEVWGRSGSHQVSVAADSLADRPALAGDFDRDCRVTSFDARQVAGAWGTANRARDLDDDRDVDLEDVTAVAGRRGATCLADQPPPGAGEGRADLTVVPGTTTVPVGRAFDADVRITDTADLGGFGLTLIFDPRRLRVADVTLDPSMVDAISLGPRIDNEAGSVSFGAFGLPAGVTNDSKLGTVTFVGRRTGEVGLKVEGVEAVDGEGRTLEAGATVESKVTVEGVTRFLPLVRR